MRKNLKLQNKFLIIKTIILVLILVFIFVFKDKYKKNDIITFGKYMYDSVNSTKKTDIEWLVIKDDRNNHKKLLLSKYILDCKCYNNKFESTTWENCTLRNWLNNDFFREAFTNVEQDRILLTEVKNDRSNNTFDKIFCLSVDECKQFFNVKRYKENKLLATNGTIYAKTVYNNGDNLYVNADNNWYKGNSYFWLRSVGYNNFCACFVNYDGVVNDFGFNVSFNNYGVRPALWIKE